MTWTPKFSACFEGPIIDNVLAVITRDMKAALDYFYPTEAAFDPSDPRFLRDFVERSIGTERGLEFPILVIGPQENLIETVDDDSHLIEPITILLNIGVVDVTPEAAYQRIMKYVRALDAVLRSANKADYCANMTNGNDAPFGLTVDVTHRYKPLGVNEEKTTYFKPAALTLSLNFRER